MIKMAPVLNEEVWEYKRLICKTKFKIFFSEKLSYLHSNIYTNMFFLILYKILSYTFYPTFLKYKEKCICDNIQFTTRADIVL